jgi:hypothetical protein
MSQTEKVDFNLRSYTLQVYPSNGMTDANKIVYLEERGSRCEVNTNHLFDMRHSSK